jgi:hypothetical protein
MVVRVLARHLRGRYAARKCGVAVDGPCIDGLRSCVPLLRGLLHMHASASADGHTSPFGRWCHGLLRLPHVYCWRPLHGRATPDLLIRLSHALASVPADMILPLHQFQLVALVTNPALLTLSRRSELRSIRLAGSLRLALVQLPVRTLLLLHVLIGQVQLHVACRDVCVLCSGYCMLRLLVGTFGMP